MEFLKKVFYLFGDNFFCKISHFLHFFLLKNYFLY